MEKQLDLSVTMAAINGVIADITKEYKETGRAPVGALETVQEARAELEKIQITAPTLAAAVAGLVGGLQALEQELSAT